MLKEVISTHSLTKRLTKFEITSATSIGISTHSLTKRLTGFPGLHKPFKSYFNSQPHEEADDALVSRYGVNVAISTHSLTKRLTLLSFCVLLPSLYFNSQPHEEADGNFRQKYIYLKLFFTLIAHINLVFYSNHYIVNFFLVKYTHFLVRMS